MKSRLARAWQNHRLLFIAFTFACAVSFFFAIRSVVFLVYWADPAHRNQPLQGWMTPRYVAHSYDLPPEIIAEFLDQTAPEDARPTLDRLARERGISTHALIDELAKFIAIQRASRP